MVRGGRGRGRWQFRWGGAVAGLLGQCPLPRLLLQVHVGAAASSSRLRRRCHGQRGRQGRFVVVVGAVVRFGRCCWWWSPWPTALRRTWRVSSSYEAVRPGGCATWASRAGAVGVRHPQCAGTATPVSRRVRPRPAGQPGHYGAAGSGRTTLLRTLAATRPSADAGHDHTGSSLPLHRARNGVPSRPDGAALLAPEEAVEANSGHTMSGY